MTCRPYYQAGIAELELELRDRRRRHADLAIMLGLEVVCATSGVAAFLALVRLELAWFAVFAIASAIAYAAAEGIERS